MDALQVLLVVHDVLLVDDAAADLQRILHLEQAFLENLVEEALGDGPREVDHLLPRKWNPFFPAGPVLFQQEDHGLEDAAVEDGD